MSTQYIYEPRLNVRNTDPITSYAAAHQTANPTRQQRRVKMLFYRYGKMTDELLLARFRSDFDPNIPDSVPRKRRCDLVRMGVIYNTREQWTLSTGCKGFVWDLMPRSQRTLRQPLDLYETPPHYLGALSKHVPDQLSGLICDPCVGEGAISGWLDLRRDDGCRLVTNDLNPAHTADYHMDIRSSTFWRMARGIKVDNRRPRLDWTVMNPPFGPINRVLGLALTHSRNVISLARLSVLEPTAERRELYQQWGRPKFVLVLPRYQFTKPSKDTMTCCWIGFGPDVDDLWTIDLHDPDDVRL